MRQREKNPRETTELSEKMILFMNDEMSIHTLIREESHNMVVN